MSTRSRIARRLADGRYHSIYCHFDGKRVGQVLREHYPSEGDARSVINHGDLSTVEPDALDAYRDRGESWQLVRPKSSPDLSHLIGLAWETGADYLYYWQDGFWQTIEMGGPR